MGSRITRGQKFERAISTTLSGAPALRRASGVAPASPGLGSRNHSHAVRGSRCGQVYDFIHATKDVLAERDIALPLSGHSTTTQSPGGDGFAIQKRTSWYSSNLLAAFDAIRPHQGCCRTTGNSTLHCVGIHAIVCSLRAGRRGGPVAVDAKLDGSSSSTQRICTHQDGVAGGCRGHMHGRQRHGQPADPYEKCRLG